VIDAGIAQYLNFFVLIAQLFMKVPALKALAPTQTEGKVTQLAALILFLVLGVLATRRFRHKSFKQRGSAYFAFLSRKALRLSGENG
jgi:hypothetical protein